MIARLTKLPGGLYFAILLALGASCADQTATAPPADKDPVDDTSALMSAKIDDLDFHGDLRCQDDLSPPVETPYFWVEDAGGIRFEADLAQLALVPGVTYALGMNSFVSMPTGQYFMRTGGSGTITVDSSSDQLITGSVEATLQHQRDPANQITLMGTFAADPFAGSIGLNGTINGVPFVSMVGVETFPRKQAHVCVKDLAYGEGLGATMTITAENLSGSFLGLYDVVENHGFAELLLSLGGELIGAIEGSLNVLAVDSIAVRDSLGVIHGYRQNISEAEFEFTGVTLVNFGTAAADTFVVTGGRLRSSE